MTDIYRDRLTQGLRYQDFVVDQLYKIGLPIVIYASQEYQNLIGESKAGIEIKNDRLFRSTGNIYFEVAEKSNAQNSAWIDSGIFRPDNTWLYIIGDMKTIFIFSKKFLQLLYQSKNVEVREIATSRGFLFPASLAEKYAIKIIEVKEGDVS